MPALVAAGPGDRSAQLALGVFTYRIAGAIAAMAAGLGGLDVLIFTGGVGNTPPMSGARNCTRIGFLGVDLDPELNERASTDADVATSASLAPNHGDRVA